MLEGASTQPDMAHLQSQLSLASVTAWLLRHGPHPVLVLVQWVLNLTQPASLQIWPTQTRLNIAALPPWPAPQGSSPSFPSRPAPSPGSHMCHWEQQPYLAQSALSPSPCMCRQVLQPSPAWHFPNPMSSPSLSPHERQVSPCQVSSVI